MATPYTATFNHPEFLVHWARSEDRGTARREVFELTDRLYKRHGRGLDLAEANLSGLDLCGFDLRGANLTRATLHGSDLSDVDLSGATLICTGLERTSFRRSRLCRSYAHGVAAQVCDFTEADLSELTDATGSLFHGCNLASANLASSTLAGATFYQCNLGHASFENAHLQGCTFNESHLGGTDLSGACVAQVTMTKCHLRGAVFSRCSGEGLVISSPGTADHVDFTHARLPMLRLASVRSAAFTAAGICASDADFHDCMLPSANFDRADLTSSSWTRCSLDKSSFVAAHLGASIWRSCSLRDASFRGATAENLALLGSCLAGADMASFSGRCTHIRDCDLSGVNLAGSYLYRAMITGDPPRSLLMRKADLSGANLVQAYIAADLTDATLRHARCAYARFNQSILSRADLSGAQLFQACFVKTDCSDTIFADQEPPFFVDRCNGLAASLEKAESTPKMTALREFVDNMANLMSRHRRGST